MKLLACLGIVTLASVGCTKGGLPTSPSASESSLAASSLSASPRSGDLQLTKECSGYSGDPGSFCTVESSNVKAIEAKSKILYLQPDQVETDIVLTPPGPGNNAAFGHCSFVTNVCTFSGGTGKFTHFQARVDVTATEDFSLWYWNGTYSFNPQD